MISADKTVSKGKTRSSPEEEEKTQTRPKHKGKTARELKKILEGRNSQIIHEIDYI